MVLNVFEPLKFYCNILLGKPLCQRYFSLPSHRDFNSQTLTHINSNHIYRKKISFVIEKLHVVLKNLLGPANREPQAGLILSCLRMLFGRISYSTSYCPKYFKLNTHLGIFVTTGCSSRRQYVTAVRLDIFRSMWHM